MSDINDTLAMSPAQIKKEKTALRGQAYFTTHKGVTIPKKGLKRDEETEQMDKKKLLVYLLMAFFAYYIYTELFSI